MKKIPLRKIIYRVRHDYLTFNNLVIFVAFLIAAGWIWGSLQVMQRNFELQKAVDYKQRQLQLAELQRDSLELQNRYYETNEYKELALRDSLGLVMPGEKLLILPDNSEEVIARDEAARSTVVVVRQEEASNLEQWMNFLFGGYSSTVTNDE